MTDFASGVQQYLLLIVVPNRATFEVGESLRIELHSSSFRMNRGNVLQSSCIRIITCFPPNRATLGLVILDYFAATHMLGGIFQLTLHLSLRLESYQTVRQTHGQLAGKS